MIYAALQHLCSRFKSFSYDVLDMPFWESVSILDIYLCKEVLERLRSYYNYIYPTQINNQD